MRSEETPPPAGSPQTIAQTIEVVHQIPIERRGTSGRVPALPSVREHDVLDAGQGQRAVRHRLVDQGFRLRRVQYAVVEPVHQDKVHTLRPMVGPAHARGGAHEALGDRDIDLLVLRGRFAHLFQSAAKNSPPPMAMNVIRRKVFMGGLLRVVGGEIVQCRPPRRIGELAQVTSARCLYLCRESSGRRPGSDNAELRRNNATVRTLGSCKETITHRTPFRWAR
jgi:hypothetical protein